MFLTLHSVRTPNWSLNRFVSEIKNVKKLLVHSAKFTALR